MMLLGQESGTLWEATGWLLTAGYIGLISIISMYGLHRYWLVFLFRKHLRQSKRPGERFEKLPRVTVQLPMFNEEMVAERIIDAACEIDYPSDRLQIQVLDDSTDSSREIAEARCKYWANRGIDIEYLHRIDRVGFKAGALEAGMTSVKGDLIAIFDADFVPPRDFLRKTVHYFTNPTLGMVQCKWGHLNRDDSLLTKGQAIFLDGHFVIEHTARNRSGAWINFNGTAGIWRREAIEAGGGWQHDTLTEDVDLSYRAQLAGWDFLFLPWLDCPAELPPEINSFKSQQHRWTKGSIQTAKKLLPRIFTSNIDLRIKIEAFFHLTAPMVYLYVTLLALLFYPAIYVNLNTTGSGRLTGILLGMTFFALGTVSGGFFYVISQRVQKRGLLSTLALIPMLMAIGIGIAVNNAIAVLEALIGHDSAFVRTPKYNVQSPPLSPSSAPISPPTSHTHISPPQTNKKRFGVIAIPTQKLSICLLEIAMGVYLLECIRLSMIHSRTVVSLPFLILFAAGYWYVGLTSLWWHIQAWRSSRLSMAQTAS
ncbi:Beta-monoglucosyldiacylglycerol synthase [Poriferisphaera corsica]|uniref:Beta-monoglucosyldiacylglycerol synthase n=1 Tax=Poriferisphaera corsica TaxID=2528020 RepID=A0A517YSI6_9BACT|nr:cellulose synthase family protein [Poriferisphaera corsica]QDU33197.1 Beta-monoglucosyldiacylglycerol synthase [Poriferisphaera corsica]